MMSVTSVSSSAARSPFESALSRLLAATNAEQSLVNDRFSSLQRRELGKILDQLDALEGTLKASGSVETESLVEPVNNQAFVQSNLLAVSSDAAISEALPANVVANGSFEENAVRGRFDKIRNVNGWTNVNGKIEVWRNIAQSADARQNVELDVEGGNQPDTLSQTVATEPGQVYELVFAYAPRSGHNLASNTFDVFFDGSRVDTIGATGGSVAYPDWKMYSFTVEASASQSEILFRETSSNGGGVLLDAVALRASDQPVGSSSINDLAVGITGTVLSDSGVQSGSIVINGQVVDIDVDNDSLDDIVNAINSADTGVNASLVSTGTVTADNLDLYRIELSSAEAGFTLADSGTGLFAAMGIQTGAYGEVYETITPTVRKRRGYRAADALEKIQQSMQRIVLSDLTIGRASIQSSMTSIFEGLVDRYGSERLSALGLDLAGLEEGFLDISDQSRRRFSKSVYENERLLEKLLLETYDRNEEGLIDVMRETIKSELGSGGVQKGSVINTFA